MVTYEHIIQSSHIISIQSKLFTCYFLTSLLKSGQLITSNQDKQSNSVSTQRLVRPTKNTNHTFKSFILEFYLKVTN